ncbi:MAG TPA: Fur family transcriptional regulator [Candidatus Saccharimonadales bacterium]|jgi:Fe2+ or Zn2+ uptake regulation protein
MNKLSSLEETLHVNGQSLTQPRREVFAVLQGEEPLTMHELVERCKSIDRASVYRTVALFEQLGVVQRLQTGWKYRLELSDDFHEHHHHATCLHCGRVIPLPEDAALEARLRRLAAAHNFALQSHQIELSGLCQDC